MISKVHLLSGFTTISGKLPVRAAWKSIASKVQQRESSLSQLDDQQLRKDSLGLRYDVLAGKPLDEIMIPAFALVREAAKRRLGMQHYPVQLIGGAAMSNGAVAVMQTGEGKTLTATLPLYLAALAGKGAHLATANDYLAARDAELMRPVFEALGMTVGIVEQPTKRPDRQAAYACDVTYSTAKEIGFDFLRDRLLRRQNNETSLTSATFQDDNQTQATRDSVQRDLHFMLVDEADSILIDEARTPLIISSVPEDQAERIALYEWASQSSVKLDEERHFEVDEETRSVHLTDVGRTAARKISKPHMLSRTPLIDIYEQLELAVLVEQKFIRDRHYIVRDGEVVIVDEFTGRMAEGRKWKAGLHQAIEARENLEVTSETAEAARITIQDLFLKYEQLAGMTGTVASSSRELYGIYRTPVVSIPTNRPPQRSQMPDLVFGNDSAKWQAIVEEVLEMHRQQRPVLVGTRSIDKSELLANLLLEAGIHPQILNARHLVDEAKFVENAGQLGQVTVATNMAGRGTDIRLPKESLDRGGLHVVVSELHESARIDRQLIGRCGRQGDPGSFRFFMSLEDDIIMSGFGAIVADRMKDAGNNQDHHPNHLSKFLRRAQARVEAKHYRGRKMLLHQERNRQQAQKELGQDPYVDTIS